MTQQDISEYLDKFSTTLVQAGHRHEAQIPIKAKSADLKPAHISRWLSRFSSMLGNLFEGTLFKLLQPTSTPAPRFYTVCPVLLLSSSPQSFMRIHGRAMRNALQLQAFYVGVWNGWKLQGKSLTAKCTW